MLMNIKCTAVTSIAVHLEFDDQTSKDQVIHLNDFIEVEYNRNGCRKLFQGKVIKINAIGSDPKDWSILVDGSGDFESDQARICPMNILDLTVLVKDSDIKCVMTTNDRNSVEFLRVVKGRLQYSHDGIEWHKIIIDRRDIDPIKEEEGTATDCDCKNKFSDVIKDEENEY